MQNLKVIGIVYLNEKGEVAYLPVEKSEANVLATMVGKEPGRIVNHPSPRERSISQEVRKDYSLEGRLEKVKGK